MPKTLTILVAMVFASESVAEDSTMFSERHFSFPNSLTKALIFSYDDGPSQDARFIERLNKYGLKGTFTPDALTPFRSVESRPPPGRKV